MIANELAQQLFKPYKKVVPRRLTFGKFSWYEWRVPISTQETKILGVNPLYIEERKFGEFSWHIDNIDRMYLIVRRQAKLDGFEERVNLLRGEVEEGIE